MNIKNIISKSFIALLTVSALGCGSSSGGSNSTDISTGTSTGATPTFRIASPESEATYGKGDDVTYELALEGFTLAPPFDRRSFRDHPSDAGDADSHSEGDSHSNSGDMDIHSEDKGHGGIDDGHSHETDATNVEAREGHYHVYLDDAQGNDPHLTSWEASGSYKLPDDISTGQHTLRFELRDNNHTIIGTEWSEAIYFFNVE